MPKISKSCNSWFFFFLFELALLWSSRYIFFADEVEIQDITKQTCFFVLLGSKSGQVRSCYLSLFFLEYVSL